MNNKQLLKNTVKNLLKEKRMFDYEMAREIVGDFVAKDKKTIEKTPVLQGILHKENKLIATNNVVLIEMNNVNHSYDGLFLLNRRKMRGEYPVANVDRLLSGQIYTPSMKGIRTRLKFSKKMNVDEWIDVHKKAWKYCKTDKNGYPVMFDGTYFCAKDKESKEYFRESLMHENEEIVIYYDCKMMIKALEVFKKLKMSFFTFEYRGELAPLLLKANDVTIVILPLRM